MEVERGPVGTNSNLLQIAGKPPKPFPRTKRHSLHSGESLARFNKLTRHSSQPRLRRDNVSGSLNNLSLDSSQRSVSLAQLNVQSLAATGKTLSASNLAAVSDSNLSIKEAVLPRSYDQPNSANSYVKRHFELIVKRYYLQLTMGCGYEQCTNRFCRSGELGSKFTPQLAAIVSIELASRNRQYFCVEETNKPLPAGLFDGNPDEPKPFLHCLFSTTPFQSLFEFSVLSNLSRSSSHVTLKGSLTNLNHLSKEKSLSRSSLRIQSHPDLLSSQLKELEDGQDCLSNKQLASSSSLKTDNKSPLASNSFNLDVEFSKVNLSGNLVKEQEFGDLPWELHGSTTSLNELVSLEQFEADCALEMSGYVQEFSLTHLTLDMLQSSIDKYNECKDPAFLINTIRTVFTSVEALNESFRLEDHINNNLKFNDLDVDAVRTAYSLLLSLQPKEAFVGPLLNAVEIHLVTLDSLLVNPDEVYQLVILMENPLLHTRQELLRKLCSVLNKLPQDTRSALVLILSRYSSHGFNCLIQVFHTFFGKHIHPSQTTEPHLIEICKVMAIFHDAFQTATSELSNPHHDLSESLFYSDDLSKKVDFKKEYEAWQAIKSNSDVCEDEMSLLEFPFLFDPASKVRVMHIDAVWQMRAEYQNAIVHQARVQQAQKIFDRAEKSNKFNDAVKAATCPFLVLSIRRDYIIRDTMTQIHLK
ncbi:uncharacterized protein LOC110243883, partial [Exaiptasia diaphana]|uniref:Ubiquitin-protein ligase E3A N-terminal zinc-binding domain-containing protein n=1 Tax=Exaiptasia diaphana TaxID=2652724 RepID=A0A913XKD4_EXADI